MPFFFFGISLQQSLAKRLLIIGLTVSLSACTTIGFRDLFSNYAAQLKDTRDAQLQGDFKVAASMVVEPKANQNNYTLNLLEKGRLLYLANDWTQSRKDFTLVSKELDEEALQAKISVSRTTSKVASLVSNDNAIAYRVPSYEQTMLHSYQALNYLYLKDFEGALVEVRKANLVQENALNDHQKELTKAQDHVDENALNQAYPSMSGLIGNVKNGFQNAYTFYLSGVLYEADDKPNDAYIDYKKALEIYPNNHYLQQDVLRLATALSMKDDLVLFSDKFGDYQPSKIANSGELVVFIESGAINPKQQVSFTLPVFTGSGQVRGFSFALPTYQGTLTQYPPLVVEANGERYTSEQIVRLQSLASKQLQEQIPGLVTRQALRLIAKEGVRNELSDKGGQVGNILAVLYNAASEKADTRSWLTLPDEIQILRLTLPPGKQIVNVNFGNKTESIEVNINTGRINLLNMTTIGSFQGHKITQL